MEYVTFSNAFKLITAALVVRAVHVYLHRQNFFHYCMRDPEQRAQKLLKQCPSLQRFMIPFFQVTGVVQTIMTGNVFSDKQIQAVVSEYKRELFHLPEMKKPENATVCPDFVPAGILAVDWLYPDQGNAAGKAKVIVFVLPGLTGCSSDSYITLLGSNLVKQGYTVACYNPRGRGGIPLSTSFLYSAGYTEDFRRVVKAVKDREPNARFCAVGFSLGSNYLTKYIGEEGENCIFDAACLCACPLDLLSASNHLNSHHIGRLMDRALLGFVQKMREELKDGFHHEKIDIEVLAKADSMHSFDHNFMAPMFGFECGSDYYRAAGSGQFLSKVKTNCLFIHARNDPIIHYGYIRMDNFEVNPYLLHVTSSGGGHSMSWPTGLFGNKSFMVDAVSEYLAACMNIKTAMPKEEKSDSVEQSLKQTSLQQ